MRHDLTVGGRFTRGCSAGFRKLLHAWRDLAIDPIWDNREKDCSWWYGERGSVSQLAGAAWQLDGWAITDYAWQRQRPKRYAQVDLCVEHRKLRLRFIAEAKQIWPCLKKPGTLASSLDTAFASLARELERINRDDWRQYMFVFATPWTSTIKETTEIESEAVEAFVESCAEARECSVLWAFPEWARDRQISAGQRKTFYPGVALFVRER
jgi:hypothetical protein